MLEFLYTVAPRELVEDFDNVGLLVGDVNSEINGILVALDCFDEVIERAEDLGANLIVTHHPVIFNPLKSVTADSIVHKLIAKGISVISMHTNLDQGNGGVNDVLCEVIGLNNVETVEAPDKYLLKKGEISPLSADDFAKLLKNKLDYPVKYVGEGEIKNILVCSGSGAQYHTICKVNGCDALVTADVRHNNFLDAAQNGIALYDCGHFNTEVIIIKPLCELLKGQFNDIVFIPNTDSQIKTAE
jgi:dinuclear metal center YbgI/SA1388 family protein